MANYNVPSIKFPRGGGGCTKVRGRERKRSDSQLKQTNKQNNKNKNDQKQQQLLAKQTLTKAHLPDHTFTKAI